MKPIKITEDERMALVAVLGYTSVHGSPPTIACTGMGSLSTVLDLVERGLIDRGPGDVLKVALEPGDKFRCREKTWRTLGLGQGRVGFIIENPTLQVVGPNTQSQPDMSEATKKSSAASVVASEAKIMKAAESVYGKKEPSQFPNAESISVQPFREKIRALEISLEAVGKQLAVLQARDRLKKKTKAKAKPSSRAAAAKKKARKAK